MAFVGWSQAPALFPQLSGLSTHAESPLGMDWGGNESTKKWRYSTRASVNGVGTRVATNRKPRKKEEKEKETRFSTTEANLRLVFLEELMQCARRGDVKGARETMYDMSSAGLRAGPHSFHGLVVAQTLAADDEGAVISHLVSHFLSVNF
eukprot:Gb_05602 [translate_table: standard]